MKVIDAIWEQRNLGVTCYEVTVEQGDSSGEIQQTLAQLQADYLVVKVPAAHSEAMFLLPTLGLTFIECSINVMHNLKTIPLTTVQRRFVDAVEYIPVTPDEITSVFTQIHRGMFTTDRIVLDPHFTREQAANRYCGWIGDEITRGAEVFALRFRGEAIGFFTFKQTDDGIYYPFLAGIYPEWQNSGLGVNAVYQPLREAIQRQARFITTYVSSNNPPIIRAHLALGSVIHNISYVYVKHR